MDKVVDELGLVRENEYIVVYIPNTKKAFPFRVVSRRNKNFEVFDYGPLPLSLDERIACFDGGSVTVPEDGVIPGRGYLAHGKTLPWDIPNIYDKTDMWFVDATYKDTLFHAYYFISPSFLRVDVQIPIMETVAGFQRGRVTLNINDATGWRRGEYEIVHFPRIHYGWRWGNDTNLDLYTKIRIIYGEYEVAIPREPEFIFNLLTKKNLAYWITLPLITKYPGEVKTAFEETYGFEGFLLYPVTKREEAIECYRGEIEKLK